MPSIEGLRQNYPVESLKILMINTGESKGLVEAFIRRSNYSFSVLLDSEGGVAQEVLGIRDSGSFTYRQRGSSRFSLTGVSQLEYQKNTCGPGLGN